MKYPIHVVQLEVIPTPGESSSNEATGAFANVYIQAINKQAAIEQARREVELAGWSIQEVIESNVTTAESFEDSEGLKYYKQCEIDGIVIEFHTWRDEH